MAKDFLSRPGGIAHFEQLRLFFESSLVRHAAEHATDEQIERLGKALELNSQSLDDNALFIRPMLNSIAYWLKSPVILSF